MSITDLAKRTANTAVESERRSPVTRRNIIHRGAQVAGGLTIAGGIFSGSTTATHREERFTTITEQEAAGHFITNPCTGETLEFTKGTVQIDSPETELSIRFAMGLYLNTPERYWMGPNQDAFGANGAGGNVGFADPDCHLAFGYCANTMAAVTHTPECCEVLIDAVFDSI